MKPSDFAGNAQGHLVQIPEGGWAFVPDPLPRNLMPDPQALKALSEADRALGELAGLAQRLRNPHLLVRPFLRREAVLSSKIEGTHTSVEQLALFEASGNAEPDGEDLREVVNYVDTMEYGLERLKELPVCLRLIKELHARLMDGVRGNRERPGEFRSIQNYIGHQERSILDARFVPPPPADMGRALEQLEHFLAEPGDLPPLLHIALVHYQFETIHPFRDGNGRMGRLLITLLLCAPNHYGQRPLLPSPLLYLSAYLERNKETYMDALLHVSQKDAWQEWLQFFFRGVAEQSRDVIKRSQDLLNLWEEYRQRMQTARASALLLRMVDELFARPALSSSTAQRLLNVTPRSADLNIQKLENVGILKEITHRKRNRMWVAQDIMALLREEA